MAASNRPKAAGAGAAAKPQQEQAASLLASVPLQVRDVLACTLTPAGQAALSAASRGVHKAIGAAASEKAPAAVVSPADAAAGAPPLSSGAAEMPQNWPAAELAQTKPRQGAVPLALSTVITGGALGAGPVSPTVRSKPHSEAASRPAGVSVEVHAEVVTPSSQPWAPQEQEQPHAAAPLPQGALEAGVSEASAADVSAPHLTLSAAAAAAAGSTADVTSLRRARDDLLRQRQAQEQALLDRAECGTPTAAAHPEAHPVATQAPEDPAVASRVLAEPGAHPAGSLTTMPARLPSGLDNFELAEGPLLGEGSVALVRRIHDRRTGAVLALKVMEKHPLLIRNMAKQVHREVKLQCSMRHPNVLRLHDFLEDDTHIYMLLELAAHGGLLGLMRRHPAGRLPEPATGWLYGQILEGVSYLHGERGVTERGGTV